jgi:hypothetical protein
MRNRVKSFFPAGLLAACVLLEISVAGQTPEPGPPQSTPPPTVERKTTRTVPNVPDDPSNGWSIGATYWLSSGPADLLAGAASTNPAVQNLVLPRFDKRTPGIRITTPAGKYNRLEISGFQAQSSGTSKAPIDLNLFGNPFPTGDTLQTNLRVRNVKVSWNYLMYPAPPTSKIRFKALFEFQYLSARTTIAAPLDTNATNTLGTRNAFLPTLGLATDIVPSSHFRVEVKASGFALPHRSYIADGEASAVFRAWHLELAGGARYYHFRTSAQSDEYIRGTLFGPFVSIRFLLGN